MLPHNYTLLPYNKWLTLTNVGVHVLHVRLCNVLQCTAQCAPVCRVGVGLSAPSCCCCRYYRRFDSHGGEAGAHDHGGQKCGELMVMDQGGELMTMVAG